MRFRWPLLLNRPQENQFAATIRDGRGCVISDIVKKRSIRVWGREALPQGTVALRPFAISSSFSAPAHRKMRGL